MNSKGLIRQAIPFLALALIVRFIYSWNCPVDFIGDAGAYFRIAKNLVEQGHFGQHEVSDSTRPPLYPILWAMVVKVVGIGFNYWVHVGLNSFLDAISIVLLLIVGKRVAAHTYWWGLLVMSLSPLWFAHVNSPITEPISITLFLAFLERWTREKRVLRDELWAGLFLGLLTLVRGMMIYFPVALLLFEFVQRKTPRGAKVADWKHLSMFLVGSFLPPFLWGMRNYLVLGRFVMSQDTWTAVLMSWMMIKIPLFDWRVPEHVQFYNSHPWADVLLGHATPERHAQVEALMKAEVWDTITQEPLRYLAMLWPKVVRLWISGFWNPYNYLHSQVSFSNTYIWPFCMPVLVFGLVGVGRQWRPSPRKSAETHEPGSEVARWRATRSQVAMMIYITAVTLPFTVDARYCVIAYVSFAIWFGAGLTYVFPRANRSNGSG